MISKIRLQNFQSHKDTTINLDPGVNAIVGKSDSGKSAIFRALYWLVYNKPSGDAFRSHWGGDTVAEITLANGTTIARVRTDKDNYYKINGKELRAFGAEAPAEVREALNIADINMQTQMDAPFLLGNSGGEVARYLNRIVSLDSIDSTLSNINKELTNAKRDAVQAGMAVEQAKAELNKYKFIDDMELDCQKLEALTADNTKVLLEIDEISKVLILMQGHNDTLRKAEKIIVGLGTSHATAQSLCDTLLKLDLRKDALHRLLNDIIRTRATLSRIPNYKDADTNIKKLQKLIAKQEDTIVYEGLLDNLLSDIAAAVDTIEYNENQINSLTKEFNDLMPETCPLCGQEVTKCEPSHPHKRRRVPSQ